MARARLASRLPVIAPLLAVGPILVSQIPPFSGIAAILWLISGLLLLTGLIAALVNIRGRRARIFSENSTPSDRSRHAPP